MGQLDVLDSVYLPLQQNLASVWEGMFCFECNIRSYFEAIFLLFMIISHEHEICPGYKF